MRRLVIALLFAAACARGQDPTVPLAPSTTEAARAASAGETTTTTASSTSTTATTVAAQPATATCPAVPARRPPPTDRPAYQLDLDVDLPGNEVVGRQTVRFTPDLPTDRLVFRLWPNGPRPAAAGAHLAVDAVYLGAAAPVPFEQPDATTVVVPLDDPLDAGETVDVTVPWRLTLPGPVADRISRRGDTVRLGTFHPVLAWEPGVGWATDPPTSLFAEAWLAPVADWSVAVSVADPGIQVLASGSRRDGRWYATAMREVGIALGRFRVHEGVANAPQPVPVTVAVEGSLRDDGAAYLTAVTRALDDFGARFGAYPHEGYTLVLTPDLAGGIEYPGFVHQGPGSEGRTTPHEVAHQWFYSLVGNHQGRDPWLDEGLATYAEARFMGTLGSYVGRSIPADARGRAGEPMTYWAAHASSYYRGVYVQGAQAIAALGAPDAVDCALRQHVARNAHRIATNRDAIEAFRTVFPDAEAVLARYGIASAS